jgi:formylglycine-generating enzyme required for sulfatase activity
VVRGALGMPARSTARPGRRVSFALGVALALAQGACGKKDGDAPAELDGGAPIPVGAQGKVLQAADNERPDGGAASRPPAATTPTVSIPGGSFVAGSTPGDRGRDPVLEPAMLDMDLGPFTIDRSPYPNDPARPALTGVTRERAGQLCQERGARLCTELEWERACKGESGTPYAGAAEWDAACSKDPSACPSGYGVLAMGALREWTSSDVMPIEKTQPKAAAVRGAPAGASGVDHRCARRSAVDATASSEDLGFRCCGGAPNAAAIASPQWQQTYRKVDLGAAQAREMFSSVAQLQRLGGDIAWFEEPHDVHLVLERADAGGGPPNTVLTTSPLLWNPVPGEEILVAAGRAGKDSFVVAFHRLPKDRHRIASVLVLENEKGPVVLGFNGYVRRKLSWSTCWDCPGESGNITYRDDNRVVITQK